MPPRDGWGLEGGWGTVRVQFRGQASQRCPGRPRGGQRLNTPGPTSFPSPISPGLQGRPHPGVQARDSGRLGLREQARDLVPRTGAQGGDGVLGMKPKPVIRTGTQSTWDLCSFHSSMSVLGDEVHLPLGPGRTRHTEGLGVLGEALGHQGGTSCLCLLPPLPSPPL